MYFKKICCSFIMLVVLIVISILTIYNESWTRPSFKYKFRYPLFLSQNSNVSKWIVVTTSRPPSDSIKYLASIPGWNVVVVGDVKTPPSWILANCTFLSISYQNILQFKLVKAIPPTSQSRKMLGYLYAISNGARIIYETEDGLQQINELTDFNIGNETIGMRYDGKRVFNPYRHFGQPNFWPNGFPLDTIMEDNEKKYTLSVSKTPSIQQGLVNGAPDIDTICTLTKHGKLALNITFVRNAPPVIISNGVFSPFNSKNTLFLYDALWAMVLPLMSSDSDILRGYWAQRLLWEIGGTIGFYPPTAFYKRSTYTTQNPDVLYFKSSKLIIFLSKWLCPQRLTFFQCVRLLSNDMVSHKFWNLSNYKLITVWLYDLQNIGYPEPTRTSYYTISLAKILFKSVKIENTNSNPKYFSKWKQIAAITNFCGNSSYQITSNSFKPISFSNVLLIIVFNHPFYDNIPYLQLMYSVTFNNIVYCGNDIQTFITSSKKFPENVTFLEQDVHAGYFAYRCITAAMKMNYRVQGYLTIGDDVLLNSWNILKSDLPFDKLWYFSFSTLYRNESKVNWHWWSTKYGQVVFNKSWKTILSIKTEKPQLAAMIIKFIETLRHNTESDQGLFHSAADIVYIPDKYKEETVLFMDIFSSYNVFLEVVVPSVIAGLVTKQNIIKLKGQYLWYDGKRNKVPQLFKKDDVFMHPVKLSNIKSSLKDFFCKVYFPLLLQ